MSLKEFLKEWWMLRNSAVKVGFVVGFLFASFSYFVAIFTVILFEAVIR